MWMTHYAQIFSCDNIFVINNNNTDDSFEKTKFNYPFEEIIFSTQFNHDFFAIEDFLFKKMQELLLKYDGVFVAEADELLFHPDGLLNAAEFYMKLPVDVVRCLGYEPVHNFFVGEPSFIQGQPILSQRKLWRDSHYMRKPVFLKKPIRYFHNMHNFDESFSIADYKLTLIHTKMLDYKHLFVRNQKTLSEANFAPQTLDVNFGWQNRIKSQTEFDAFFKTAIQQSVAIPEKYRGIM